MQGTRACDGYGYWGETEKMNQLPTSQVNKHTNDTTIILIRTPFASHLLESSTKCTHVAKSPCKCIPRPPSVPDKMHQAPRYHSTRSRLLQLEETLNTHEIKHEINNDTKQSQVPRVPTPPNNKAVLSSLQKSPAACRYRDTMKIE